MENLPKDVQEKIVNELSAADFVRVCATTQQNKEDILFERLCNDNGVWYRRLQKDFGVLNPLLSQKLEKEQINYKNTYLELFSKVSKTSEIIFSRIMESFGRDFLKFINKDYSIKLMEVIFEVVFNSLEQIRDPNFIINSLPILTLLPEEYYTTGKRKRSWEVILSENTYNLVKDIRKYLSPVTRTKKPVNIMRGSTVADKLVNLSEGQYLDISYVEKDGTGARIISTPGPSSKRIIIPGTRFAAEPNALMGVKKTAYFLNMPEIIEAFENARRQR